MSLESFWKFQELLCTDRVKDQMSRPECVIPDTLSQVSKEFECRQLSYNGPYCHLNITDNAQPRPESDSLHNFSWKHSRQRQRREGVKNIQKGGGSIVKLQS